MAKLNFIDWLALLIVTIGAINWGAIGVLNMNLLGVLFSSFPEYLRYAYGTVGVAGFWMLIVAYKLTDDGL